jgi:ligand-binding SRPBCC domain-containing protein
MTEPYVLKREQWIPQLPNDVFQFFSNAGNLEKLTPPWLNFRILTAEPIRLHKGAEIRYQLSWRGIPLRWKTEITRWEPIAVFEDLQVSGPYRLWHHTHTFEPSRGGTLMTDTVRYALPFGPLGRIAHALMVRRNIEAIFDYRYRQIAALFGDGKA